MRVEPARTFVRLEQAVPSDLLRAEVRSWAARIGVSPREIRVRSMRRKWASCSSVGRITLSEDLLLQPASFRAEVIAHELLHLKVPNHGRVFRALLRALLANRAHAAGHHCGSR